MSELVRQSEQRVLREPDHSLQMPDLYGRLDARQASKSTNYLWLSYSIFFFIEPIIRHSLRYWLEQAPIYLVFLALYVCYVQVPGSRLRQGVIAAIFLLGVVTIPFNVGASCFFIYVGALLPFCVESTAVFIVVMALEAATLALEAWLFPGNPFNYAITGFFAVVVGFSNLYIAQGKRADLRLRRAEAENVELASVAERERIARDLHDVLGHTLSVIVLKAELAGRLLERGEPGAAARAAGEIADVEQTARTALAEVRETIGGYRAKGLEAELDQARRTLDAAGVELHCDTRAVPLILGKLGARDETVLSLAVREAVTNIVRHAHATECTMHIGLADDGFCSLEVADNGSGACQRTGGVITAGNGLRGMRERVEEMGGRFHVHMEETAGGTRLRIELPGGAGAPAVPSLSSNPAPLRQLAGRLAERA